MSEGRQVGSCLALCVRVYACVCVLDSTSSYGFCVAWPYWFTALPSDSCHRDVAHVCLCAPIDVAERYQARNDDESKLRPIQRMPSKLKPKQSKKKKLDAEGAATASDITTAIQRPRRRAAAMASTAIGVSGSGGGSGGGPATRAAAATAKASIVPKPAAAAVSSRKRGRRGMPIDNSNDHQSEGEGVGRRKSARVGRPKRSEQMLHGNEEEAEESLTF